MPDDTGNGKNKKFIEKLFGSRSERAIKEETEEEILSLVSEGQEQGYIGDRAGSVIHNIFDFDDIEAGEIMTHRTDMLALSDELSLEEAARAAIESGYSRIPVYHEDIDNIIGVLYAKDLLKYLLVSDRSDFSLKKAVRPVLFVPKTKNCSQLYAEMTKRKVQLAVVVDEYGGTEGLVTLEDLIEEILGNIQDEYDDEEEDFSKIGDNKFTVDGSMPISAVEQLIKVKLPDSGSDTIAGFVLEQLGRIPKDGEQPKIILDKLTLTVIKTDERRISRILLEKNCD